MDGWDGPVLGVVGGCGGVGASSFAALLAGGCTDAVLVDLDVDGGGIDVLLGIEAAAGARWSGLRLAGGALSRDVLVNGLPRWGPCAVLAADVASLSAADVGQVIEAAARGGPVILDLPRADSAARTEAVRRCALVVVLARADVAGLVAAHAVVTGLGEVAAGVVVRRGEVPAEEAARLVGARLLGQLRGPAPGRHPFDAARPGRATARVVRGVLDGAAVAR